MDIIHESNTICDDEPISQNIPNNKLKLYIPSSDMNRYLLEEVRSNIVAPHTIKYSKVHDLFKGEISIEGEMMLESSIYLEESKRTNIEHLFPQSFFKHKHNELKSDLHHIFLSDEKTNSKRSNYSFEQIRGTKIDSFSVKAKECKFNPPKRSKGKIARSLAYVFTLYPDLIDFNSVISFDTMVIWNMVCPVTDEDNIRNDHIEHIQGNRNPFIDDPTLINRIWGNHSITMDVNDQSVTYTPDDN